MAHSLRSFAALETRPRTPYTLTRGGMVHYGVPFTIELEREEDGRWIAEVRDLPGVLCYGQDRDEAVAGVQALALRVIAEHLENREAPAEFLNVTFQAA